MEKERDGERGLETPKVRHNNRFFFSFSVQLLKEINNKHKEAGQDIEREGGRNDLCLDLWRKPSLEHSSSTVDLFLD